MRQPPPPNCSKCHVETWFFGTTLSEYSGMFEFAYLCEGCDKVFIQRVKFDTVTDKQGRI